MWTGWGWEEAGSGLQRSTGRIENWKKMPTEPGGCRSPQGCPTGVLGSLVSPYNKHPQSKEKEELAPSDVLAKTQPS